MPKINVRVSFNAQPKPLVFWERLVECGFGDLAAAGVARLLATCPAVPADQLISYKCGSCCLRCHMTTCRRHKHVPTLLPLGGGGGGREGCLAY